MLSNSLDAYISKHTCISCRERVKKEKLSVSHIKNIMCLQKVKRYWSNPYRTKESIIYNFLKILKHLLDFIMVLKE